MTTLTQAVTAFIMLLTAATAGAQEAVQMRKLQMAAYAMMDAYVDPVPGDTLVEAAIEAMLGKLDPHSTYMNADEVKRFEEQMSGKFYGVGMAALHGCELLLVLGFVAPQDQQVVDAEKLQVDKSILCLGSSKSAAYKVGYGGEPVTVLYGSRHGNGARAHPLRYAAEQAVGRILIDQLATVRGDIDVCRIKFAQHVDGSKSTFYGAASQRR